MRKQFAVALQAKVGNKISEMKAGFPATTKNYGWARPYHLAVDKQSVESVMYTPHRDKKCWTSGVRTWGPKMSKNPCMVIQEATIETHQTLTRMAPYVFPRKYRNVSHV